MSPLRLFSFLILIIFFSFGSIVGCDGGGGECAFDINTLTNGSTVLTEVSFWDCIDSELATNAFSIFDDGTGFSTGFGGFAFTWVQTGCDSVRITFDGGTADIIDISVSGNFLTFVIESDVPELDGLANGCELIFL